MSLLQNSNAISSGSYQISNSLRFQSASTQYLSRTPASAGNQQKWTYSTWIKRGALGVETPILNCESSGPVSFYFYFDSTDKIQILDYSGGYVMTMVTSQVFRDPSSWYHIVLAVDTTQATAANRVRLYVNGSEVTAFGTASYPSQNTNLDMNRAVETDIGRRVLYGNLFDGYQAEINFVNAQQLTPSSFGATNTLTGQWCAAKYTGTYGTNGFYLPFSNGTSTTTLGADSSGNGNNWTLTNFTRSAGVSDCWMLDVPSGNGYAGTQPSSNYAVLNAVSPLASGSITNSNLKFTSGAADCISVGTIGVSSGKWYWEVTATTVNASNTYIGILGVPPSSITVDLSVPSNGYCYLSTGNKGNNNSRVAYGASFTSGDVIGVALDMDAGTLVFYKNNASQGTAYSSLNGTFIPAISDGSGASSGAVIDCNFGQRSFAYTPPTGFKALCTANLPAATIVKGNQYMDATTYTGTGATLSITNAGAFKPDLVWVKSRSNALNNKLTDSVRGVQTALISNSTGTETTDSTGLTSFNSNGFTLGSDATYNTNAATYVGWQWQAGQGTTSSNTNGSITSTVSVNTTAGFSVVTYAGNGSSSATVGHGLGVAPKMIILKNRSNAYDWPVMHASLPSNGNVFLNSTQAYQTTFSLGGIANPANSSTFGFTTTSTLQQVNGTSNNYVAYCFAEIAGFSKFGSYTGNGSTDGPFIYTGFTPKFLLIKVTSTVNGWVLYDTVRNTYNYMDLQLYPNLSNAESQSSTYAIDALSNGFKLRDSNATFNANGASYIYMAFASNPFAQANAR